MDRNEITLIGNVGTSMEMIDLKNNHVLGHFKVATHRKSHGESITDWHRVVAWNGLAEKMFNSVVKGERVLVVGELRYLNHTNKEGEEKRIPEISASYIEVLKNTSEIQED